MVVIEQKTIRHRILAAQPPSPDTVLPVVHAQLDDKEEHPS